MVKMTLSLRLFSIGAVVVAAFCAMALVAEWSARRIEGAMARAEALRADIDIVANLRQAHTELVLTAMDIIVDKNEGAVSAERLKAISEAIAQISAGLPAVQRTAKAIGGVPGSENLPSDIAALGRAISVDLKKLVESRAQDEAFGAIDDAIDGAGERIKETLSAVLEGGTHSLEKTIAATQVSARESTNVQLAVALAALMLIGPALMLTIRSTIGALTRLRTIMDRIVRGDLDQTIPEAARQDEIGAMARQLEYFRDNALSGRQTSKVLEADRRRQAERQARLEAAIATFRKTVGVIVGDLDHSASDMTKAAETLADVGARTHQRSDGALASSREATESVETMSVAVEQLASSIEEINSQVVRANDVVKTAASTAQSTNHQITTLSEAAQKIGDVVNLISAIAEQTNLLALNATIESARAGEAGRGFAVVASEVKSLATQTAKATNDIAQQIAGIQTATELGVREVGAIASTMVEITNFTSAIASAVHEQSATTSEISRHTQHARTSALQSARQLGDVATAVAETAQSSKIVLTAAGTVDRTAADLRRAVDHFMAEVAAA